MAKIRLSFEITEEGRDNLLAIAKELGCYWSGKPSWRKMLTAIANLDLEVRKVPSGWRLNQSFYAQAQQLTSIPVQPPAWNAPVATSLKVSDLPPQDFGTYAMHHSPKKSEFVADRGDGTFVDTEEFDKPVPQKRVPAVLPESSNVQIPSLSSNVEAMKNATKEQKIQAALAAMGSAIKKGSEL